MNKLLQSVLALVLALAPISMVAQNVNIIPLPLSVEQPQEKPWQLPRKFTVAMLGVNDPRIWDDMSRFTQTLSQATRTKGTLQRKATGDIRLKMDSSLAPEGYALRVSESGVDIAFSTSAGCFYALQSLKRLFPAHVYWGIEGEKKARYTLPAIEIKDEPRYGYRGFMLDVSRHFFSVEQIKRVLDIMAVYKMNRFHWHLTDDQGWRIAIDKYPRLTEVGSVSSDMLMNDEQQTKYMYGKPYGPFFYTKDDVKTVVDYAAQYHIEVIPEVDMPGHMMAAMAAYPEFSSRPDSTYEVWTQNKGLSVDILDVCNPAAVQFARDVVDELCQMFPGPDIHIGGDECPIIKWEQNPASKFLCEQYGLESCRGLQNWFIGEMAKTAALHGKGIFAWNESITSKGADPKPMQENNVKIMCWVGADQAARKASALGLDAVITPIGPYYINRKQWAGPDEPFAAGPGNDSLSVTYNYQPLPANTDPAFIPHYTGVQATFWTEFVSSDSYLEYLMLPRLMAVAEAGWTPQERKNFPDFVRRFNADIPLLDLKGYNYGKHYVKP